MKKYILITFALLIPTLPASGIFYDQAGKSQFKIGIMKHDLSRLEDFKHRYESGQNVIVEYVFSNQYEFLRALPHIGASVNVDGYTSAIYTGVTWNVPIGQYIYLEGTFGFGINNGEHKKEGKRKRNIGSPLLFRESFSVGVNLSEKYNFSAMIDHMSSASITRPNPGLTDIGIRLGVRF